MVGRSTPGHGRGQPSFRGPNAHSRGGGVPQTDTPAVNGRASTRGFRGRGGRGSGGTDSREPTPKQELLAPQNPTPIRKPVIGIAARAMRRYQAECANNVRQQRRALTELHIPTEGEPRQKNEGCGSQLVDQDKAKEDTAMADDDEEPENTKPGTFVSPFELPLPFHRRKQTKKNTDESATDQPIPEAPTVPQGKLTEA